MGATRPESSENSDLDTEAFASSGLGRAVRILLTVIAAVAALSVILLPVIDLFLSRLFWTSLPAAAALADHGTLILAFAAAALASLDHRHISIGALAARLDKSGILAALGDFIASIALGCLFWATLAFAWTGFDPADKVWLIPTRALAAIMPLSLLVICASMLTKAGQAVRNRGDRSPAEVLVLRAAPLLGLVLGSLLGVSSIRNLLSSLMGSAPAWMEALVPAVQGFVSSYGLPLGILFALSLLLGAPIFSVLAGIACLLYIGAGSYVELAASEAYDLLKGGSISALPLFGLAGVLLAESGAGRRFVAVFREFFGWFRGGEAIAAVLACAVFSTFTGINGVTIVALGGILVVALTESGGLSEGRARGLVTASGDIGLLIPPSAAVIVYGVNAQFLYGPGENFSIVSLFKAALVPGLVLVASMCLAGVFFSPSRRKAGAAESAGQNAEPASISRRNFNPASALKSLKPAILELIVPLAAILLYFTGFADLREVGAITVLYIAIVESLVKRELGLRAFVSALGRALPIIGGTLIIIAVARGLSFYLIDANVPSAFASWIQARIDSKFLFLLLVNFFLIGVGCLMDIFSAILIVSPFLIPLARSFGVPPTQFGVIFITNLLMGFLTPTVGMNVFLASYTFRKPVTRIVRDTWPFLIVQFAVLMLVTYVPGLSTIFQ